MHVQPQSAQAPSRAHPQVDAHPGRGGGRGGGADRGGGGKRAGTVQGERRVPAVRYSRRGARVVVRSVKFTQLRKGSRPQCATNLQPTHLTAWINNCTKINQTKPNRTTAGVGFNWPVLTCSRATSSAALGPRSPPLRKSCGARWVLRASDLLGGWVGGWVAAAAASLEPPTS